MYSDDEYFETRWHLLLGVVLVCVHVNTCVLYIRTMYMRLIFGRLCIYIYYNVVEQTALTILVRQKNVSSTVSLVFDYTLIWRREAGDTVANDSKIRARQNETSMSSLLVG